MSVIGLFAAPVAVNRHSRGVAVTRLKASSIFGCPAQRCRDRRASHGQPSGVRTRVGDGSALGDRAERAAGARCSTANAVCIGAPWRFRRVLTEGHRVGRERQDRSDRANGTCIVYAPTEIVVDAAAARDGDGGAIGAGWQVRRRRMDRRACRRCRDAGAAVWRRIDCALQAVGLRLTTRWNRRNTTRCRSRWRRANPVVDPSCTRCDEARLP